VSYKTCLRCHNPPRECQCEIYYYKLLLCISVSFPIAELLVGKLLAHSNLVLLDGLHALAHGAFFYFAYRVSREVAGEFLTLFEETKRRQRYAQFQATFLFTGMALFLFFQVFRDFTQPKEIHEAFTVLGALIGLAGAMLSLIVLNVFKNTRETNLTYDIVEIHIHADIWTSIVPIAAAIVIWTGKRFGLAWVLYVDPLLTAAIAIWFMAKSIPFLIPRQKS